MDHPDPAGPAGATAPADAATGDVSPGRGCPADADVAVVLTGGGPAAVPSGALPPGALVIAADGGAVLAGALGLAVHVVVGDLDSLDPSALAALAAEGAQVERHPADKDATDLELALDRAVAAEVARVVVVGGAGGRLDHLLGVALVLGSAAYARVDVEAWLGPARLDVVRPARPATLRGDVGDDVSLLALHGPALGVRTEGLAWPLRGEALHPGSTRGVSNRLAAATATVAVDHGVLLAVRPGTASGLAPGAPPVHAPATDAPARGAPDPDPHPRS